MFASPAKASGCIFEKHVNWTLAVAAAKTSKATLLLYNSIVIWNDLGEQEQLKMFSVLWRIEWLYCWLDFLAIFWSQL